MSENHPDTARIFATRQGSADDAGQEGPLGGADAGLWQKDRRGGVVFGHNDYSHDLANFYLIAPFTTNNFLGIPTNDYCDLWKITLSGNFQASPACTAEKLVDGKHFSTHGGTIGIKVHFRWGSSVEIINGDNFKLHTTERNFANVTNYELVYNTFSK